MADKPKPVHSVRIGAIKGAIWKNKTEKGPRYNVTFERLYKTKERIGINPIRSATRTS